MARPNSSFGAGVSELVVLRLLSHREMYGYELAKAVKLATGKAISVGEGVLYPLLHVLEARGLVRSRQQAVGGRTRIYYTTTVKGRGRLHKIAADWRRVSDGINAALEGIPHA